MKTLSALISTFAVTTIIASAPALACTYDIAETFHTNTMIAVAASEVDVSLKDVHSIETSDFSAFESIPSSMCPKEITYDVRVKLKYANPEGSGTCSATFDVKKIDSWEGKQDKFKVEERRLRCR